jgi:hypothetical protein
MASAHEKLLSLERIKQTKGHTAFRERLSDLRPSESKAAVTAVTVVKK